MRHPADPIIVAFVVAVAIAVGVIAGADLAHWLMGVGAVLFGV